MKEQSSRDEKMEVLKALNEKKRLQNELLEHLVQEQVLEMQVQELSLANDSANKRR